MVLIAAPIFRRRFCIVSEDTEEQNNTPHRSHLRMRANRNCSSDEDDEIDSSSALDIA